MSDFIHLHCHTEYSMLDGAIRLKDLCQKAKDYGMGACAVTDHGNMFAAASFQKACTEFGIKPIFGCEVYTCRDHLDTKSEDAKRRNHLILLAKNMTGYHNLVKVVTKGWLEGFFYKPRVDWNILKEYSEGIICLTACIQGEIPQAILSGDMDKARRITRQYAELYKDNFYLELQHNGLEKQTIVNNGLLELAESEHLPVVATNDCHYLNADDYEAHEILLCIGTGSTINDKKRFRFETHELYYKSPEEMERDFASVPQAIENTAKIAEMCNCELTFGKHFFPKYPLPEGASLESEFRKLAEEGLERRFREHPNPETIDKDKYRKRLQHEIGVILEMGFPGYFLIVQEFINWAKNHGVPTGPGRGSAAGSLVAWSMRITNLDPMPYNLLFERFLNIERVSLPDIDVDFCERRRYRVIRHMADTYGEDSVSQIAAFGKMKAKAVIHDVGRVLGMSFQERAAIAKLVPGNDPKIHISDVLKQEPELQKRYDTEPQIRHLLDIAMKLEGLTRQASMHAAGLVVSDKPMVEYLPLFRGKHGEQVTQFDGPMVEQTGLVKFDFLGLKTMTLIQDALDNIKLEGEDPPNLDILPFTDQATYDLYSRGDTDGVFQVEGSGMRQYLRMLHPSCFEDLIAMLALYRPGPLGSGMVDEFIKRKHGEVPVVYPHPSLESCLKDTYGVIVYQEQVMQIAQIIANYTLGGADLLRRAMGKKKAEAMAKQRSIFVKGAAENNISEEKANEIFDLMEKFAAYGFNKSHSAAYAQISYYTAWLKVHHTCAFMAALLTSEMGNQEKLLKYISCCKDRGVDVLPPSVNYSQRSFSAKDGKIVFGLGGIKNVGDEAIQEIVNGRKNGEYKSLYDLCTRVNMRKVTKRVLESLIKGGAFDCTGATRQALLCCLDLVVEKAQRRAKLNESQSTSLLALSPKLKVAMEQLPGVGINCPDAGLEEFPDDIKLQNEKEALGFYLTSHPLQPFTQQWKRIGNMDLESLQDLYPGAEIRTAVLVTSWREALTKAGGKRMAFVQVEDLTGHAEVTFFHKAYTPELRALLESEQPLWLTGRLDKNQEKENETEPGDDEAGESQAPRELRIIGDSMRPLQSICQESRHPVVVQIPENRLDEEAMLSLRAILEKYPGSVSTEASVLVDGFYCHLSLDPELTVTPGPELDRALSAWAAAGQ